MPTLPRTFRLQSTVTANRSILLHGSNSRFQHLGHRRAQGKQRPQTLVALSTRIGNTEIAVSVITLLELAHGVVRADTSERKARREQFIEELLTALPIHPVSAAIALRAGQIDGQNQAHGMRLPLSDLLIGVTALELGYSVATGNVRHFRQVPGLSVVQL